MQYQHHPHQQIPQFSEQEQRDEIPLFENGDERQMYEDLADLAGIIKAADLLEIAFSRQAMPADVYTRECSMLISHFRSLERPLIRDGIITSTEDFVKKYEIRARRGLERLALGIPATALMQPADNTSRETTSIAVDVSLHLVTAMNAVQLGQRAVDELQPLMVAFITPLSRMKRLPADEPWMKKLQGWLISLNSMTASERISEEQARQLSFDLDNGLTQFREWCAMQHA